MKKIEISNSEYQRMQEQAIRCTVAALKLMPHREEYVETISRSAAPETKKALEEVLKRYRKEK